MLSVFKKGNINGREDVNICQNGISKIMLKYFQKKSWLYLSGDGSGKRVRFVVSVFCIGACAIYLWSNIAARVFPQGGDEAGYYWGSPFPSGVLAGHDFWVTYTYSKVLLSGHNINSLPESIPINRRGLFEGARGILVYPPFAFFVYIPYSFLSYPDAYSIQMILILLANIAVIFLASSMAEKWLIGAGADTSTSSFITYAVVAAIAFITISSYGFLFSVERGSSDVFAMLFAWLFLHVLIRYPERRWMQALLLSLAINIKLTPVIFSVLFLWKHKWRAVIPMIVINSVMMMVWGGENALIFLKGVARLKATPDGWWGDHSAFSFAYTTLRPCGLSIPTAEGFLIAAVFVQWVCCALVLWRRGYSASNALFLFAVSVPVMMLVPNCSNDYKLILLAGPFSVFAIRWAYQYANSADKKALVFLFILFPIMGCIAKSGGFARHFWAANKFPLIFLFGFLMMLEIFRSRPPVTTSKNDFRPSLDVK